MRRRTVGALAVVAAAVAAIVVFLSPGSASPAACSAVRLSGDPALHHPMALTRHGSFLYVADAGRGVVKKLRRDGTMVAEWRGFERPVAAAVAADGAVLVADFLADVIVETDSAGVEVRRWGDSGTGDGQFDAPAGVALGPGGDVYVSDFYNHRVQRFRRDGRFVASWGSKGIRPGRFRFPTGVALDAAGRVLVADAFNHRIQVFSPEGRREAVHGGRLWGLGGSGPGRFRVAKEVAVDAEDAVWVADAFNGRVQKLDPSGAALALWDGAADSVAPVRYPAGLAPDGAGGVFVTDFFGSRLTRVSCP